MKNGPRLTLGFSEGNMEQLLERKEYDEGTIARINISEKVDHLHICIKSNPFFLGNNSLTLLLITAFLIQIAFAGLISNSTINLTAAVSIALFLGSIALVIFLKFWLWHHFGEELIRFHGNALEVNRSYGLFTGNTKTITFNKDSELYVNRADTWSWLKMRSKGMLRAVTNQEITHFGVKLNDEEYAMIVKASADRLNMLKETNVDDKAIVSQKPNGKKVLAQNSIKRNGENTEHLNGHNNNPTILNGNANSIAKQDPKKSNL